MDRMLHAVVECDDLVVCEVVENIDYDLKKAIRNYSNYYKETEPDCYVSNNMACFNEQLLKFVIDNMI